MLILNPTRKSRIEKTCCGSCKSGGHCCGKPRRTYAPRFQRQNGLWLPRRELFAPRAMLQYPGQHEWSGGLVRPWLPARSVSFDMSCTGCCDESSSSSQSASESSQSDFCESIQGADLLATVTDETGDCTCLPATVTLVWTPAALDWRGVEDPICGQGLEWIFSCNPGPTFGISLACGAEIDVPPVDSSTLSPFEVVFLAEYTSGSCCTGTFTVTVTIL